MSKAQEKIELLIELKNKLFNEKLIDTQHKLTNATKKMRGSIDKLKTSHIRAFNAMKAEVPGLGRALDLVTNKYVLMAAGIAGIGMLAYSATKKAAAFNHEFLQIQQMNLDKPRSELETYKKQIKDAAFDVGTDLNDSTRAFYDLQSGTGLFGDKAVEVFKKVGKYSIATGADLNDSMNATVKAMEAMGLGVKDIDAYLTSNAKTVQTGITTYSELAKVQTQFLGAAASAGQNIDVANKVFAGFTKIAKNSDTGANMAKTFFEGLTTQADKIGKTLKIDLYDENHSMLSADKILEKIAGKFKNMSQEAQHLAIQKIGGPEGLRAMLQKVGVDAEGLLKTFKTFDESKFNIDKALENAKGDFNTLSKIVKNRWNTVLATMGEKLLPMVAKGLDWINNAVEWAWNNWETLGPILKTIGAGLVGIKLASIAAGWGLKFMGKAILGIPILGWIIAIATAIYELIDATEGWKAQWQNLKDTFSLIWEGMKLKFKIVTIGMYNAWKWLQDGIVKAYYWAQNLMGKISDQEYNRKLKQIKDEADLRKNELISTVNAYMLVKKAIKDTASWKLKWKSDKQAEKDSEKEGFISGTNPFSNGTKTDADTDLGNQVTKVTGAAAQVRNITVNIGALNEGGINTEHTTLQNMDADEIEQWFNESMMRVIRNVELSMS